MHMVFLICISTYLASKPSVSQFITDHDYGIILDGGSSGTKLKIYKWRVVESHDDTVSTDAQFDERYTDVATGKLDIKLTESKKFRPGVSEIAYALHNVESYLLAILDRAATVIPISHHRRTPLYFMATAGLRSLPLDVTESLLDAIEMVLLNVSLNPFATQVQGVRVLSGEEEAVYAWVAANYLRGYFWSNKPPTQTVGVLEMGGGSTQIAFLPDHSVYANMFPVRIGGRTYQIYAHSYLFYGQNYIVSRINDYLVAIGHNQPAIPNPCMLKGDNTTVTFTGIPVLIYGSADVKKCLEIINIFLQTADDSWCYPKPCAIGRTYQPHVGDIVFYAISAFIYAPEYLKAIDDMGRLNVSLLLTNAIQFCKKNLSEVQETGQYASQYCTMGLYIPSLLRDAYRFNEGRNTIYVKGEINDINIDWSLGAMLIELEQMDVRSLCDREPSTSSSTSNSAISLTSKLTSFIIIYNIVTLLVKRQAI